MFFGDPSRRSRTSAPHSPRTAGSPCCLQELAEQSGIHRDPRLLRRRRELPTPPKGVPGPFGLADRSIAADVLAAPALSMSISRPWTNVDMGRTRRRVQFQSTVASPGADGGSGRGGAADGALGCGGRSRSTRLPDGVLFRGRLAAPRGAGVLGERLGRNAGSKGGV